MVGQAGSHRRRRIDPPPVLAGDRERLVDPAAFVVCLGCGVFVMSMLPRPRIPPPEPSRFDPPASSLPSGGEDTK